MKSMKKIMVLLTVIGTFALLVNCDEGNNSGNNSDEPEIPVPSGTALWARSVSEGGGSISSLSYFKAVTADSSGNVYAMGCQDSDYHGGFYNILTYGPGVSAQTVDYGSVLVKYNSDGTAQWAQSVNGERPEFNAVAVDSLGNVYAVGYQRGSGNYTYGPGVSVNGSGYNNVVLVKYDSSGTAQWARSVSTVSMGSSDAEFNAVAVDSSGNVYAAGHQFGDGNYTYGPGVSAQGTNRSGHAVLVKYNSNGTAQWAQIVNAGTEGFSGFNAVAVDFSGNVYAVGSGGGYDYDDSVGGYVPSLLTYGPGISAQVDSGSVLVKYNSSGVAQWAKTVSAEILYHWLGGLEFANTGKSEFKAVAVDSSGNVYVAGYQKDINIYTYGPGITVKGSSQGENGVLVKYNSDGTAQWAQSARSDSGGSPDFSAVAVDSSGNVYAAGSQWDTVNYYYGGVSVRGGSSNHNAVLVKYDSNGTVQWAQSQYESYYSDIFSSFHAVTVDLSGNVYAAGVQINIGPFTYGPGVSVKGCSRDGNAVLVKYKN